jgi:hypothetical protein
MAEEPEQIEGVGDAAPVAKLDGGTKRLHSSHSSGMESSILRFKNVNFVVGKGEKEKHILRDVSGTVKWGRKFSSWSFRCSAGVSSDHSFACFPFHSQMCWRSWVPLVLER